jgi:hypothetical protein
VAFLRPPPFVDGLAGEAMFAADAERRDLAGLEQAMVVLWTCSNSATSFHRHYRRGGVGDVFARGGHAPKFTRFRKRLKPLAPSLT